MAVTVVDRLEAVEVEIHDGEPCPPTLRHHHALLQAVGEQAAVGEPGQRIVVGDALELLIRSILVGYGIDPSKIDDVIDDMGKKLGFDDTEAGKKVAEMPEAKEEATPVSNNEEEAFQQGFEAETTKREGM